MARLGMRAGEVRQLKLDDIDWIQGEIHVRAGKSRRERTLPLLEEVGKVLGAYMRQERPESAERKPNTDFESQAQLVCQCPMTGQCQESRNQPINQTARN